MFYNQSKLEKYPILPWYRPDDGPMCSPQCNRFSPSSQKEWPVTGHLYLPPHRHPAAKNLPSRRNSVFRDREQNRFSFISPVAMVTIGVYFEEGPPYRHGTVLLLLVLPPFS